MAGNEKDIVTTIMKDTRTAMLTYVDEQGRLVSLPMATQDFEDPSTVHFMTEADSDKMSAIAANPRVNVAYSSDEGWVSLSGTARRNDDPELMKKLWDAGASAFMEGGPEDPNNTLLTISAETAEYWDSPGKVATVVAMVKGIASDSRPDMGDNDTVRL